jgi:hypothetical protein
MIASSWSCSIQSAAPAKGLAERNSNLRSAATVAMTIINFWIFYRDGCSAIATVRAPSIDRGAQVMASLSLQRNTASVAICVRVANFSIVAMQRSMILIDPVRTVVFPLSVPG